MKQISENSNLSFNSTFLLGTYMQAYLVQNTNISIETRTLESTRNLKLKVGQTALISYPSTNSRCLKLSFDSGIARIYGSLGTQYQEITLGFCGNGKTQCLRIPRETSLLLEGMTNCLLLVDYIEDCESNDDLMMKWLLDLHIVRHPVGADARLYALLRLLVSNFGVSQDESYSLPFTMGHSLIAELIGSTRSTVTRQLSKLRKNNILLSGELDTIFILTKAFIHNKS